MFKKKFILILLTLLVVCVGAFVYQWWQAEKEPIDQEETETSKTPEDINWKTYRNEDFGFEFQYPENWTFHPNTFYSPFSKFNLIGASPEENGLPDIITPSLLINIVTSDFADRAIMGRKNLGAVETDIIVGGVHGVKYEYDENYQKISIDLPIGKFRMILGAKKEYEDTLNQILTSFKFLK